MNLTSICETLDILLESRSAIPNISAESFILNLNLQTLFTNYFSVYQEKIPKLRKFWKLCILHGRLAIKYTTIFSEASRTGEFHQIITGTKYRKLNSSLTNWLTTISFPNILEELLIWNLKFADSFYKFYLSVYQ